MTTQKINITDEMERLLDDINYIHDKESLHVIAETATRVANIERRIKEPLGVSKEDIDDIRNLIGKIGYAVGHVKSKYGKKLKSVTLEKHYLERNGLSKFEYSECGVKEFISGYCFSTPEEKRMGRLILTQCIEERKAECEKKNKKAGEIAKLEFRYRSIMLLCDRVSTINCSLSYKIEPKQNKSYGQ